MVTTEGKSLTRVRLGRGVLKRPWGILVTATLLGFLLLGSTPAQAAPRGPNRTQANYEITFMKEMIAHHHMAVMMSEVCVERQDIRPELRNLCQQIIAAQEREIAMMQSWLRQWYGIDYQPHEDMDHEEMSRMLAEMRAMSPAEFERFFLEDMIVHHAGALQPARQCKGRAFHSELEALCRDIVRVQVDEIELMRRWLCEWFGECNFHIDPHRRRAMHGVS